MTLVEVVVAVGLLALILSCSYPLITQTAAMLKRTRDHHIATTICLARIERARNVDYGLLTQMREPEPGVLVDDTGAPVSSADDTGKIVFSRITEVTPDNPEAGVTMFRVVTRIRDRRTRRFGTSQEEMSCMFTSYLSPPVR